MDSIAGFPWMGELDADSASRQLSPGRRLAALACLLACGSVHAEARSGDAAGPTAVNSLSIAAAGDVMLGNLLAGHTASASAIAAAAESLRSADLAFLNAEGPFFTKNAPVKPCTSSNCHAFGADPLSARILAEAGVDLVSLANNHAKDLGIEGAEATRAAFAGVGISTAGSLSDGRAWASLSRSGATVSLLALTANSGPFDWRGIHSRRWLDQIAERKARGELVVVSVHGGCEGAEAMDASVGDEFCFGENRGDVVSFARMSIDRGADLFFGHGPHVPRRLELRSGRLIALSLGNFATGKGISIRGPAGTAPLLRVSVGLDGRFLGCRIESFVQTRPGGLVPDPQRQAETLMRRLSGRERFPCDL